MKKNKIGLLTTISALALTSAIVIPTVLVINNNLRNSNNTNESTSSVNQINHISLLSYNNNNATIKVANNKFAKWYVSSNRNLSNEVQINPIANKNGKVTLQIPSNYKGELFYFAKTKNGSYTNSIKIKVNPTNSNNYVNVEILGDKNPTTYHYRINGGNIPKLYSLTNKNNLLTTNKTTSDIVLYNLSQEYKNFFTTLFNYLSSKEILSKISFSSLSTSSSIYLPSILQNWSNYSISHKLIL